MTGMYRCDGGPFATLDKFHSRTVQSSLPDTKIGSVGWKASDRTPSYSKRAKREMNILPLIDGSSKQPPTYHMPGELEFEFVWSVRSFGCDRDHGRLGRRLGRVVRILVSGCGSGWDARTADLPLAIPFVEPVFAALGFMALVLSAR